MRKILLLFVLTLLSLTFVEAKTVIKGVVKEKVDAFEKPLMFANVFVEGTTIGTTTDMDGKFEISIPDPGMYTVAFSFLGYVKQTREIEAKSGGVIEINDVVLIQDGQTLSEVKVSAKANDENEQVLMLEQKKAIVIKESIGAKSLSNLGISDAAAATTKISGVNKAEGSGDIYVRGLGDRYLSTTMNGLPIPSDDVEKKNMDLNQFSTNVIKNVGISKTYDVSNYADQASGNVDVSSKTMSRKVTLGLSGGGNTNVFNVFDAFKATQNHNDLTLGFYQQPYEIKEAVQQQSWNTVDRSMPIDYGFSILGGKKFNFLGNDMSVFATLSHSGKSEYQSGSYKRYKSNYLNEDFKNVEEFATKYNTTALLNLTYDFNANNSLNFNSVEIFKTTENLYEAGREGGDFYFEQFASGADAQDLSSSVFVRDQNVVTTRVFINQLLGKHTIGDRNDLDWGLAYNYVGADEPNRIRNVVSNFYEDVVNFAWEGGYDQRKTSQIISDNEMTGYVKDALTLKDEENKVLKINMGLNGRYKVRDFESNFVGVVVPRSLTATSIDDLDVVLMNDSYYNSGELDINYQKPNVYNGTLTVMGGYANFAWELAKFSGSAGVRYEYDNIYVDWDVSNTRAGSLDNDYNNILPALNLKYQLSEKSNLRLAASKTVTLPEFKELAPFEYVAATGRVTVGNPELLHSQNYNVDLKWEMFPRLNELVSATAFYKLIKDPINRAQQRSSSGNYYYNNTGDQATVFGLELEGRFHLLRSESKTSDKGLLMSYNLTKMWFNQDLKEEFQYNNITETGLEGASDLIVNGAITYTSGNQFPWTATVSGNYSSDKIFVLGAPESQASRNVLYNSEIIEKGFVTLDLVLKKEISRRVSVRAFAKNLLDPEIQQTQLVRPETTGIETNEVVMSYKKGMQLGVGVSINLN